MCLYWRVCIRDAARAKQVPITALLPELVQRSVAAGEIVALVRERGRLLP